MASPTPFLSLLQPLTEPARPRPTAPSDGPSAPPIRPPAGDEELAKAQAAAREILAAAEREAAEIREDAQVQAEAFREAAWQEGRHAGQEEGRRAAEADAQAARTAQQEALRAEVQAIVEQIGQARQTLWEQQEGEMVAFVLDIARQVIKTEVSQNPEIIAHVLRNALRRVTDKSQVRIRVALPDAERVRGMRDDLLAVLDGIQNLEILDDRRVGRGGCVIETQAGTIDAKIETQTAEIARALQVDDHEH